MGVVPKNSSYMGRRGIIRSYLWIFAVSFFLVACLWLPSGGTQIGGLPFMLRLGGLMRVLPGPVSLVCWDLRYNNLSDAFVWILILILDLLALIAGITLCRSRIARIIGYAGVAIWVFMGFLFSISGL